MMRLILISLTALFLSACAIPRQIVEALPDTFADIETIEIVPMLGDEISVGLFPNYFLSGAGTQLPLPASLREAMLDAMNAQLSPRYRLSVAEDPLVRFDMQLFSPALAEDFETYEVVRVVTEESTADAVLFITWMYADDVALETRLGGAGLYRDYASENVYLIFGLALVDQSSGRVIASSRGMMREYNPLTATRGLPILRRSVTIGAARYPGKLADFTDDDAQKLEEELVGLAKTSLPFTLGKMGLAD